MKPKRQRKCFNENIMKLFDITNYRIYNVLNLMMDNIEIFIIQATVNLTAVVSDFDALSQFVRGNI